MLLWMPPRLVLPPSTRRIRFLEPGNHLCVQLIDAVDFDDVACHAGFDALEAVGVGVTFEVDLKSPVWPW